MLSSSGSACKLAATLYAQCEAFTRDINCVCGSAVLSCAVWLDNGNLVIAASQLKFDPAQCRVSLSRADGPWQCSHISYGW